MGPTLTAIPELVVHEHAGDVDPDVQRPPPPPPPPQPPPPGERQVPTKARNLTPRPTVPPFQIR